MLMEHHGESHCAALVRVKLLDTQTLILSFKLQDRTW